jgi:hypothetical protein
MLRYLQASIDQLRWQRLPAFQKLAAMLLESGRHPQSQPQADPVRSGGSYQRQHQALLRRGRGSTNLRYLLLKAQRQPTTKTEFIVKKPEGPKPEGPSQI